MCAYATGDERALIQTGHGKNHSVFTRLYDDRGQNHINENGENPHVGLSFLDFWDILAPSIRYRLFSLCMFFSAIHIPVSHYLGWGSVRLGHVTCISNLCIIHFNPQLLCDELFIHMH